MSNYDWVFWLNVTNIALGVVVVLTVLVVAYGLAWELISRYKKRAGAHDLNREMQAMLHDEFAHSLPVPELGMTMADGGEQIKSDTNKPPKQS